MSIIYFKGDTFTFEDKAGRQLLRIYTPLLHDSGLLSVEWWDSEGNPRGIFVLRDLRINYEETKPRPEGPLDQVITFKRDDNFEFRDADGRHTLTLEFDLDPFGSFVTIYGYDAQGRLVAAQNIQYLGEAYPCWEDLTPEEKERGKPRFWDEECRSHRAR